MSVAVFELGGALALSLPELAIGPWTHTPPGSVAFDAGVEQPASLWRVDLSGDDAASQTALAGGERSVARAHAVLDDVPRRLDRVLERALAEFAHPSRSEPARGARGRPPAPELPQVDSDLVAALVRGDSNSVPGGSARPPGRLERALRSVGDLARGRARIETHLESVLVACSVTTLSGDTELWIVPRLSPASARLHARSVAIAVQTRHAWVRLLALVVTCCGRLAAFGMSGGVAALPLVWSFLRDVLRELRDPDAASGAAPAAAQ